MPPNTPPVVTTALGAKGIIGIVAALIIVGGGGAIYMSMESGKTNESKSDIAAGDTAIPNNAESDSTYVDTQWNQAVGGTAGMPENWPKDAPPAYAGATLMSALSKNLATGKSDPSVIYFTDASRAEIIDYYVKNLNGNGWKIEANADSPAGYYVITAKKDTRSFAVFISVDPQGKTGVTSAVTF